MGSASEAQYHFLLAYDLQLLNREDYVRLSDKVLEVKKMLASLNDKVRASGSKEVSVSKS